jgi:hypothetical protein
VLQALLAVTPHGAQALQHPQHLAQLLLLLLQLRLHHLRSKQRWAAR